MSLLRVEELSTAVIQDNGSPLTVVDRVSFTIDQGEILGLVGESGCGKSMTALSIIQLLPQPHVKLTGGQILFDNQDLSQLSPKQLTALRGNDIAIIFQDPMTALNPVHTIGKQIMEVIAIHEKTTPEQCEQRAIQLLTKVGINNPEQRLHDHPHKFSGGMRQRVMIAIALACKPKLLIADEPTTALDVTIQAEIIALIRELQNEYGMAVLFITHDLSLVAQNCDRVAVMYAGKIIETAPSSSLFSNPKHPYTRGLMAALPRRNIPRKSRISAMAGQVPQAHEFGPGCRFANRCDYATEKCQQQPPLEHGVACWHWEQVND